MAINNLDQDKNNYSFSKMTYNELIGVRGALRLFLVLFSIAHIAAMTGIAYIVKGTEPHNFWLTVLVMGLGFFTIGFYRTIRILREVRIWIMFRSIFRDK